MLLQIGRKRNRVPKLRRHRGTDRAAVVLEDGRYRYLGQWGSQEARVAYDRLVAAWLASGRSAPALDAARDAVAGSGPIVLHVVQGYKAHVESYYRKPDGRPTREVANCAIAMRHLRRLYGPTRANEFGPLKLKALREHFVGLGWTRGYVNTQVGRVIRGFKWAVENELVEARVLEGLKAVAGLRRGRSQAPEGTVVQPVDDADVAAILPYLSPTVRAMVQVQRFSAMRPGEVVQMRLQDIDRSKEVWIYRPASHKTEHHGRDRPVPIGLRAQAILEPFLRLDGGYLFQPKDALTSRHKREREARTTPLDPSKLEAKRRQARERAARGLKWKSGDCYTVDSYRRAVEHGLRAVNGVRLRQRLGELLEVDAGRVAVEALVDSGGSLDIDAERVAHLLGVALAEVKRAAKALEEVALVPHWHPNRLRHSAATEIRREFGLEGAQVVLGHARADVTQIYAERDMKLMIEVAKRLG